MQKLLIFIYMANVQHREMDSNVVVTWNFIHVGPENKG